VRELLVQNGLTVTERDYFKEPFTEQELSDLVAEVGEPGVSAMFASRSPSLKKMGLTAAELSDERKLSLMLEEPRLVRRPLVRLGDRLLIGASVKAITEALSD
jgi:arsenate reductase-like glutaredoxin family protein